MAVARPSPARTGMSLIELLVAMAVGSILLAAMATLMDFAARSSKGLSLSSEIATFSNNVSSMLASSTACGIAMTGNPAAHAYPSPFRPVADGGVDFNDADVTFTTGLADTGGMILPANVASPCRGPGTCITRKVVLGTSTKENLSVAGVTRTAIKTTMTVDFEKPSSATLGSVSLGSQLESRDFPITLISSNASTTVGPWPIIGCSSSAGGSLTADQASQQACLDMGGAWLGGGAAPRCNRGVFAGQVAAGLTATVDLSLGESQYVVFDRGAANGANVTINFTNVKVGHSYSLITYYTTTNGDPGPYDITLTFSETAAVGAGAPVCPGGCTLAPGQRIGAMRNGGITTAATITFVHLTTGYYTVFTQNWAG